ncbi:hypothetical protein D1B33_04140 [Lysinibacillus yapensis]|uniref:Uncharacterized protein n=1 Tax=Ureibacillus yapensis TaxID=2304605 RepID=A0A396SLX7_9BACL|nr:hypothetical protein D1B33_04140 [Lysinibacillus yapensis]
MKCFWARIVFGFAVHEGDEVLLGKNFVWICSSSLKETNKKLGKQLCPVLCLAANINSSNYSSPRQNNEELSLNYILRKLS